ncbi:MAG: hypothetical protein HC910_10910 [Spirulinaceae cyanobacterium SM2_1_0]|nr:hypothetical protein [Spirulinaceae cyanobacterium SM2_1_0]
MADSPPPLQRSMIAEAATPQSLERGDRYYRQGRILKPHRQAGKLWGECYGSELYKTSVTLNADGTIAIFDCTCPYDWGGICKHQVALLLAYLHEPQQFQVIAPVETLLEGRSREDLVMLIERMLKRNPELLDLIAAMPASTNRTVPLTAYHEQI